MMCVKCGKYGAELHTLEGDVPRRRDDPSLWAGQVGSIYSGLSFCSWTCLGEFARFRSVEERFVYTVIVECASQEQADEVMGARLGPDEDYGFDYLVEYYEAQEGDDEA